MLAVTGAIKGAGLGKDVLLLTDGRFSGGTTGLCIPVTSRPRPRTAGRSRSSGTATRSASTSPPGPWTCWSTGRTGPPGRGLGPPAPRYTRGVLAKYAKLVGSAAQGAICG